MRRICAEIGAKAFRGGWDGALIGRTLPGYGDLSGAWQWRAGPQVLHARAMPVDLLSDEQANAYGRFAGTPSRSDLERYFFLDDKDLELVKQRRRESNRLGFGVALDTVRCRHHRVKSYVLSG